MRAGKVGEMSGLVSMIRQEAFSVSFSSEMSNSLRNRRGSGGPAVIAGAARYLALPHDAATVEQVLTSTLRDDLGQASAAGRTAPGGQVGELWDALRARVSVPPAE